MCRALGLLQICSLIGIVKGLNPGVILKKVEHDYLGNHSPE